MSTGTEVAVRRSQASAMPAKLQYAHELANSGLLPAAYRRNPGNVLWAVEFGEMLGLPPMAAITGVHVIEGKPTASAGLISALVRRAGHKLRVSGDAESATCQIIRADDPDYTFTVTFTAADAGAAGLLGKDVWKKYRSSMLKARAITQCARDACEEALFGLHYTAEELGAEVDEDGVVVAQVVGDPVQQLADPAADDPWYVHPSPEQAAAEEWVAANLRIIPDSGLDACRKLWREAIEKGRAGEVPKPEAEKVLAALTARMEALKNAQTAPQPEAASPVAAGLDPDDPWALKVEELGSEDEAADALVEASVMLGDGEISEEYFGQIEAAIAERFPGAGNATGVAA